MLNAFINSAMRLTHIAKITMTEIERKMLLICFCFFMYLCRSMSSALRKSTSASVQSQVIAYRGRVKTSTGLYIKISANKVFVSLMIPH